MAMIGSPPPQLPSAADDAYIDQLDDDIAKVRAEIASLTKRRSMLSASLLSSTKVQAALHRHADVVTTSSENHITMETTPLTMIDQQSQHNLINVHRLAFGITSFPFTDPNPETSDEPLLGIRFDIPSQNGRFDRAPYYLLCKKISGLSSGLLTESSRSNHSKNQTSFAISSKTVPSNRILTVHHHTIPAFVPLQDLIDKYLPQPNGQSNSSSNNTQSDDEGYDSHRSSARSPSTAPIDDPMDLNRNENQIKQDVHSLASAVYMHLSSQANRKAAIALLSDPVHDSLSSMSATGEDCYFVRLIWHDGLVGRLKLTDDGFVERAVVFGDEGRMKDLERLLSQDDVGDPVPIVSLRSRLDQVALRRNRAMDLDGTAS